MQRNRWTYFMCQTKLQEMHSDLEFNFFFTFYISTHSNKWSENIISCTEITDDKVLKHKQHFKQINWSNVYLPSDVNSACGSFTETFMKCVDKSMPVIAKTIINCNYNGNKPWTSRAIAVYSIVKRFIQKLFKM